MEAWEYHWVSLLKCWTRRMLREAEQSSLCCPGLRGCSVRPRCRSSQPCSVKQHSLLSLCSLQRARASRAALHIPALPEMCLGSTGVCLFWFSNYVRQQQSHGELYRTGVLDREEMGDLSFTCAPNWTRSCLCRLPKKPIGAHQRGGTCSGAGTLPPWTAAQIVPYFINRWCHLSFHSTAYSPGILLGMQKGEVKRSCKKSLY